MQLTGKVTVRHDGGKVTGALVEAQAVPATPMEHDMLRDFIEAAVPNGLRLTVEGGALVVRAAFVRGVRGVRRSRTAALAAMTPPLAGPAGVGEEKPDAAPQLDSAARD